MTTTQNEEAQELLDSRLAVYGERVENMTRVAQVFSGILGIEVRPDQVPLLMVGYKTVRASQTPDYEDNIKDIEGYGLMFREIIGDDMIAAVNTDEYLAEKRRREPSERPVQTEPAPCSGCGYPEPGVHTMNCPVNELNKHVRSYNGRYKDEQSPLVQAERMQKEVPSYQPGANMTPSHLMGVYREQLQDIFIRSWKDRGPTIPSDRFAEIAAREAVEYFWLTFKRNQEFEAGVREFKAL